MLAALLLATIGAGCQLLSGVGDLEVVGAGGAGGSVSTGGAGGTLACAAPCDDGNPCTLDSCQDGQCIHQNDDSAVPAQDSNECTNEVCSGGQVASENAPPSIPCGMGAAFQCDGMGVCSNCTNGIKDSDETDIDCGGSCPLKCNGQACADGAECKSTFCADGVCCNGACGANAVCKSCDLPGKAGTCSVVTNGLTDPDSCMSGYACNGTANGSCELIGNKKLLGEACASSNECFNGRCSAGGFCGLGKGDPCDESYTCVTKQCTNNVCIGCTSNAQCDSKACDTNVNACKIPLGEPCGSLLLGLPGCAAGSCKDGLCKLANGGACTKNTDCVGFCNAEMKCKACANNADCGNGGVCTNGACLLPQGSRCATGVQCASGMCIGFPPQCQ